MSSGGRLTCLLNIVYIAVTSNVFSCTISIKRKRKRIIYGSENKKKWKNILEPLCIWIYMMNIWLNIWLNILRYSLWGTLFLVKRFGNFQIDTFLQEVGVKPEIWNLYFVCPFCIAFGQWSLDHLKGYIGTRWFLTFVVSMTFLY